MSKGRLKKNAAFSILEVLVSGLGLFLIYRNVAAVLGVSMLGIWSLVLATTSFGRLADIGIAAGLSRFIARARNGAEPDSGSRYFLTGAAAVGLIMGLIALIGWWPLHAALSLALSGEELQVARGLLPWALLTFWLLNLNAVTAAALLGLQRADLRAIATIAGMCVQIAASYLFIERWRLQGLAWAQALQYLLAIATSVVFLLRMGMFSALRNWFSLQILKELVGFGAKLQIGTIANLLFEPASKIVLGHVAGTAVLGLFEMAYRMVYQVRNVAIMALQNLIPAFVSRLHDVEDTNALFLKSNRTASLGGGTLMIGVIIASPLVSVLWLNRFEPFFCQLTGLIACGWLVNIVCAPAYFFGMASGRVNANIGGQVLTGLLSPALGYILGDSFGALAAVVGILSGKVLGDLFPLVFNRPKIGSQSAVGSYAWPFGASILTLVCELVMQHLAMPQIGPLLAALQRT